MTSIHAQVALLPSGLTENVRVTVEGTVIVGISQGREALAGDERVGLLLPGMASLHSHAFQRGMAGLAEVRGSRSDSFWTWRETMYRFAHTITPDQLEAIAAQLYVEMLESGFTRVGEFHYLHHAEDGQHYCDIAEMAGRICGAAANSGIELTLLPALYAHSSFGGQPPLSEQRRFVNSIDNFARIFDSCRRHAGHLARANVGVAPHSLRAVTPEQLGFVSQLDPSAPIHIHVAEQTREVDDCVAWSGKRPVEWLLANARIDQRWCLIHATHMTPEEVDRLAKSGATTGVCPITEANLGDGIFDGYAFVAAGGRYGIGTDSNILIGVTNELRQFEYSQRLGRRSRNVLAGGEGSTGSALYENALHGGHRALGFETPSLAKGSTATFIAVDLDDAAFAAASSSQVLDAWIFAGRRGIDKAWIAGGKWVEGGRHIHRDKIEKRFKAAMKELASG